MYYLGQLPNIIKNGDAPESALLLFDEKANYFVDAGDVSCLLQRSRLS